MSYARRRNRKLKRDLVSKPKLVEKVVKEHNKKAKEQREEDEKFEKIIDKYGADNFNITDAQDEEIINEIQIKTIEYLYKKFVL